MPGSWRRASFVAGGDAPAPHDLVETLGQIARSIKVSADADWLDPISFRWDVCPRSLLTRELPDPVGVISAICEQRRSGLQFRQENRAEAIVVCLAGREAKAHRQTIGVHDRVNLARQSASRATHILLFVAGDAGPCWWTRTMDVSIICTAVS